MTQKSDQIYHQIQLLKFLFVFTLCTFNLSTGIPHKKRTCGGHGSLCQRRGFKPSLVKEIEPLLNVILILKFLFFSLSRSDSLF